ncbi:MAG TPA: cytochrome c3 family protein [Syntrophorhabdaceae bacterium]|jgi:hypothetical protein
MAVRSSSRKRIWTGVFCSIGALFFLLAVSNGAWSQKAGKDPLLGEKHTSAGIKCAQCHKEKPSSPVTTGTCTGCHADVAKPSAVQSKKRNPHDAHMPFPDCASCHHAHKTSENQCDVCHDFGVRTP